MHPKWLDYLCDPVTEEPLTLHVRSQLGDRVEEGELRSSRAAYPIVRGVPRFAGFQDENSYVKSFSYQWTKWSRVQFESENVGKPLAGHTRAMWEKITTQKSVDLGGAVIADFGCGPGRFIEVVRSKHGRAIGLDLSDAVEAARNNFVDDDDVLICQADVLAPPIRKGVMDGAFSIGVLHHTPDPRLGIACMLGCVKEGGWVAAAVYSKGRYYDFPTVRGYRAVFRLLWPVFRHYPALVYSWVAAYGIRPLVSIPVFGLVLRVLFPVVPLRDPKWALLDTFDSVTPQYQSTHEGHEVQRWFQDSGARAIRASDWGSTAYSALR